MSEKLERVKYRKSALREVIFQVKFPSILRIDTEVPAEFQEMVRQKYPMYNDRRNETIVKIKAVLSLLRLHGLCGERKALLRA